jgi:hypothetical protein
MADNTLFTYVFLLRARKPRGKSRFSQPYRLDLFLPSYYWPKIRWYYFLADERPLGKVYPVSRTDNLSLRGTALWFLERGSRS